MWFALTGDERLQTRCATENCPGAPTWRLEAEGVGSNYCSGCHARIIAMQTQQFPGLAATNRKS